MSWGSSRVSFAVLTTLTVAACDPGGPVGPKNAGPDTSAPDLPEVADLGEAQSALEADLRYLREEEKLARDVYRTMAITWGVQVFSNIAGSEESHTTRVASRLAELGLPDPVVDDTVGVFVDESLAELFTALSVEGRTSLEAALRVGATIKDLDLQDLAEKHTRTGDPATLQLYEDLMCGSRNHLRAFVGQLAQRGRTYTAQFLGQSEVDAIIASPRETCASR